MSARMGTQRMHRFVSPGGTRYMTGHEFCLKGQRRDGGAIPHWKLRPVVSAPR